MGMRQGRNGRRRRDRLGWIVPLRPQFYLRCGLLFPLGISPGFLSQSLLLVFPLNFSPCFLR